MTTTQLLSGSLAQALGALRRPQRFTHPTAHLNRAVERAFIRFAACHGGWSNSLFDRHFLRYHADWILAAYVAGKLSQSAAAEALAAAWDQQFGDHSPPRRRQRRAELVPAAADFLGWLVDGLA